MKQLLFPDPLPYLHEILRVQSGGELYGTSLTTGDVDLTGIAIEYPRDVTGLGNFDHLILRTAGGDNPSGPDDVDLTVYGLRKWMGLAVQGNPSILLTLFAPTESFVHLDVHGISLCNSYTVRAILSRHVIPRFRGYMRSQALRLVGEKGAQHGARTLVRDGKFAAHMVRLGYQGVELASTGAITLPMPEAEREVCLSIRKGELSADDAFWIALSLDEKLGELEKSSALPDEPDYGYINHWLHNTYQTAWRRHDNSL